MAIKDFGRGFKNGFQEFSKGVGHTISIFMLLLAYVIGIGIVAVISKTFRKNFLQMKKQESYWVQRNLGKQELEEYKRAF